MADPNRADNEDPLGTLRDITDYSWGMPAGYNNQHLILAQEETRREQSAMDMLRLAMADQKEITPTQGMAAALLAAIPTLGGALIGRSVGRPNIPEGSIGAMNYDQFSKMMGPHPVVSGAALGQKVSSDYLGSLEEQKSREADTYEKLASIELNRAGKAGAQDAALIQAGLGKQAEESLLDKRLAAEMPLREQQLANEAARLSWQEKAEERRQIDAERRRSGAIPLKPTQSVIDKVGLADSITVKQERLRGLAEEAFKQLGPGFTQSFARKGIAALPANAQQEFLQTVKALAMELNRAVDPTPSIAGQQAQEQKLFAAIENGHFFETLDQDVRNARALALSTLEPFSQGPNPNEQAKGLLDFYKQRWKMDTNYSGIGQPAAAQTPQSDQDPAFRKIVEEEKARLRAERGIK